MADSDPFNNFSPDASKSSIISSPNLHQNNKEEVTIEEVSPKDRAEPHSDPKTTSSLGLNERQPGYSFDEKLAPHLGLNVLNKSKSSEEKEKLLEVKVKGQQNPKRDTNTAEDLDLFNKFSLDVSKSSITESPNLHRNNKEEVKIKEVYPKHQAEPHSDPKATSSLGLNEMQPGYSSDEKLAPHSGLNVPNKNKSPEEEEKLLEVRVKSQHELEGDTNTAKVDQVEASRSDMTKPLEYLTLQLSKASFSYGEGFLQDHPGTADLTATKNNMDLKMYKEAMESLISSIKNTSRSLGSFESIVNELKPKVFVQKKRASEDKKENVELEVSKQPPNEGISRILEGYEVIEIMGKGAHGIVLKVRNQVGEIKALKLYRKDHAIPFSIELTSIISMNSVFFKEGGLGLSTFLETDEGYGLVIDAGVGTLYNFKEFLQAKKHNLEEKELLRILFALKFNYDKMDYVALCHRDIKPHNIILHANDLSVEIIDYSLSICRHPPRSLSGLVGTLGYIDPHIYNNKTNYTIEDVISSDYFALGVTILELADLEYIPEQNDRLEREKRLEELSKTKKDLADILRILLNSNLDQKDESLIQNEKEFLKGHSMGNIMGNTGFPCGLEKYSNDFLTYMLNRPQNTTSTTSNSFSINERMAIPYSNTKLTADTFFRDGLKQRKEIFCIEEWSEYNARRRLEDDNQKSFVENMKAAAEYYTKDNQKWRALQAYENIIKFYLQVGNTFEYSAWSYVLYNIILKEDSKTIFNPLLFSTLGTCFSLINEVEKAEAMFIKGLERAQGLYTELILLNNYGCLLFELKKDSQKYNERFESAYEKIKKLISDASGAIMKKWLMLNVSKQEAKNLHFIQTVEERSIEIVRSLKSFVSEEEEGARKEKIRLVWIIFSNICFERADCLRRILESDKSFDLFDKIKKFVLQFYRHNRATFKLPRNLEIFRNIFEFHKLFADENKMFSRLEVQRLIEESEAIDREKTYLFYLFQEENMNLSFQELKETDLFRAMVGVTLLYHLESFEETVSNRQLLDEKISVISQFTPSFQITIMDKSFDLADIDIGFKEQVEHILLAAKNAPQVGDFYSTSYGIKISTDCSEENAPVTYSLNALDFDCHYETWRRTWIAYVSTEELNSKLYASLSPRNCLQNLSLSKLRVLYDGQDSTDAGMQEIAQCISLSRSLECVNITQVVGIITPKGLKCLEEAIKGLKHLKRLRLKFFLAAHLTDESIISFASVLIELPALQDLTLKFIACPKVTKNGVEKVRDLLNKHPSLIFKRLYVQIARMDDMFWLN